VVRFAVRALVAAAAGVMAAGFLDWRAGLLVAGLVVVSYLLLGGAAPRIPAPWGRGRLLRALQRHGYRIAADPAGRHVLIGPGGVFLLESRAARNAVSRADGGWRIGDRPAERVVDRLAAAAVRVERALVRTARARGLPEPAVVPVIVVSGRLPEPVMRADRAVIARPRAVLRFILDRPEELDPAEVDALTAAARRALAPR